MKPDEPAQAMGLAPTLLNEGSTACRRRRDNERMKDRGRGPPERAPQGDCDP